MGKEEVGGTTSTRLDGRLDRDRFAGLYSVLCSGNLKDDASSVSNQRDIVRELEKSVGSEFKNTDDFHKKCCLYISTVPMNEQLRVVRETLGHNQTKMAAILSVARPFYAQMEAGSKPVNVKTLRFMRELAARDHAEP